MKATSDHWLLARKPLPPMFPGGLLVGEEELAALARVIESKCLFRYYGVGDGPREVASFEREWQEHFAVPYALCVNAGSSALICGLIAAGVKAGDEVIVPAYTWNASANAVLAVGGIPVLAEVDESLTLDPADVARKVTARTRALLPVHMRGGACDMDPLCEIALQHGLAIVEDACQSVGASYKGRRLGTIGDFGAYSLQYNKIITTGEGGMFVCHDADAYHLAIDVHDCAGSLRRSGELPLYPGYNFRASELTGAVGRVQLGKLEWLLAQMRDLHGRLARRIDGIAELELRRSNDVAGDAGVAMVALAKTSARAGEICDSLVESGVPAMQIYRPDVRDLHIYPYWRPVLDYIEAHGGAKPDCPRTLELLERTVHFDLPPTMDDEQVEAVGDAIERACARGAA